MYPGANALDALKAQGAAHQFGQGTADDQPQACPLTGPWAIDLNEGTEQPGLVGGADADAGVAHIQLDSQNAVAGNFGQQQTCLHFTTVGELDGVADQVGQNLLEAQWVSQHPYRLCRQLALQMQPFGPGIAFEHPQRGAHQFDQIGRHRLQADMPGFDAGNVENIANQLKQANGRIMGGLQGLGVAAAAAAIFQGQFQQTDHRIHWGTYLMAHGGQEGAFGLAGLFGIVLGLA